MSTLPARWAVASRYSPGSMPWALHEIEPVPGARLDGERDVDHHVADDLDRARLTRLSLAGSPAAAAEEQSSSAAGVVAEHAVELLGHRHVVGAHPGLDVGDRDAALGAAERARERRVGVAVDEHEVGRRLRAAPARAPRASARSGRCAEPSATPSSRSGAGIPSSEKKIAESRSSKCWPVWTRISSWARRSSGETAAALTNCGRFPMTVRTFTRGPARAASSPALVRTSIARCAR